jgi:hypothetical protein
MIKNNILIPASIFLLIFTGLTISKKTTVPLYIIQILVGVTAGIIVYIIWKKDIRIKTKMQAILFIIIIVMIFLINSLLYLSGA